MTQDELIDMAREAQQENFVNDSGHWFKMELKDLERFAALVAAKEREACAKVCDKEMEYAEEWGMGLQVLTADKIATAIRARSEK